MITWLVPTVKRLRWLHSWYSSHPFVVRAAFSLFRAVKHSKALPNYVVRQHDGRVEQTSRTSRLTGISYITNMLQETTTHSRVVKRHRNEQGFPIRRGLLPGVFGDVTCRRVVHLHPRESLARTELSKSTILRQRNVKVSGVSGSSYL